ncbi:Hypothetical predicted protein [Mytilus galloprovincialis]|uniref:DZIP3-like HEPN domain-containing protein n=1 Tax=Mytilus galloprovincialis TaxID=29158 RepID=A0A8B6DA19_MYTGA|nr:Hypothetical predicted protein [Mytilus galloprovincialis]
MVGESWNDALSLGSDWVICFFVKLCFKVPKLDCESHAKQSFQSTFRMATSLPQEDINFLRLAGLLQSIAPRAVRRWFDKEFHPNRLKQFLSKNRNRIHDMTFKNRVITQSEYNLLFPKDASEVSSLMFDVSLMVCLLKHFTDLDIQDNLPPETIHTTDADISRIKFYRNYIVHSDSGKITERKFTVIWKCVVEAIVRLLPELKLEIDALMSSSVTNGSDIKNVLRLEKELEKTNQHLSAVNQKLETLEIQHNNIREIRHRILKEWRETNEKYVSTSATTFIFKSLQDNRGVVITGSPGCGKSAAAHHVALKMGKEGYEIVPCDDPSEILKHFIKDKIQVFVIDDICGKFTLNQQKADLWEQIDGKINMLTESFTPKDDNDENSGKSKVRFIITCRENIYRHNAFPNLTCFSLIQCSFSTKYKISPDEMRNIALSYVPENIVNEIENICLYDFFPFICGLYFKKANQDPRFFTDPVEIIENEISVMKIKSESSFLCLSLLVLKSNNISKDDLRSGNVEHLVKSVCSDCDIELVVSMVTLQNCFERLKGIYIIEEVEKYTAIHDKMFDIIAAAIAPYIMKSLITYAEISFLANRIHFLSFGRSNLPCAVHIPQALEIVYFKRIYKEALNGKYWEVFGGIQAEKKTYRNLLLFFLKEQDTCQQISYVTSEDGQTPLFVSSYLGYVDFVEYFIAKCPYHINVKDKEGRSSLYVACKNGHIAAVKYLMKYYEDVNAEMAYKTTALSTACKNGHIEVVQLLLDNNADINRTNKFNKNALYFACRNGNVQLVSLLLSAYDLDIKVRNTHDQTTLLTECQNGHTETSKQAKEFCRDVNQQSDPGFTPLYIACLQACQNGHNDTVKFLLDLKGETFKSCVDTRIKTIYRWSVLHFACFNGHTEVAKLLLVHVDNGMTVNDRTNNGATSLYLACMNGHLESVKCLLALNGDKLNSCVDTTIKNKNEWSVVHIACFNGHIEVVKLLIGVGMNINETLKDGSTALYLACEKGHYETVKYLLDLNGDKLNSRVNTTLTHKNGESVLHIACFNGHTEVTKLLIDVRLNVNDTSHKGYTPLIVACMNGHYDTVKFLLDLNGDKLNSCIDTAFKLEVGYSALHVACYRGHTNIVRLLLKVNVNINDKSKYGLTPLHLACLKGHYETVTFLIDLNGNKANSRVDTTLKAEDAWSVLHAASCEKGHYETVKCLLDLNGDKTKSRVDTKVKDTHGNSASRVAFLNQHTEIKKLLTDHGINEAEQRRHSMKEYCVIS